MHGLEGWSNAIQKLTGTSDDVLMSASNAASVRVAKKYPEDLKSVTRMVHSSIHALLRNDEEVNNIANDKHWGVTFDPNTFVIRLYVEGHGCFETNVHGMLYSTFSDKLDIVEGVDSIILLYSDYVSDLAEWDLSEYDKYMRAEGNSPFYNIDLC